MIRKLLKAPLTLLIFTALGAATGIGLDRIIGLLNSPWLPSVFFMVGACFIFLVELAVLPWLFTSISLSLGAIVHAKRGSSHIVKSFLMFLCALLIVTGTGLTAGLILAPGSGLDQSALSFLGSSIQGLSDPFALFSADPAALFASGSFPGMLLLIPFLALLILAVIFGFASGTASEDSYSNLSLMLRSLHEAFKKIVNAVLYLLPFALFFLTAVLIPPMLVFPYGTLLKFLLIIAGSAVLFLITAYLVIWRRSGKTALATLSALVEPLLMSLSSSEPCAVIPSASAALENKLGYDGAIVGLNIPFGLTAVRFGQVLYNVVSACFFLQLYNVSLEPLSLIGLFASSAGAALLSVGPGALLSPVLMSFSLAYFGLPGEAAILFLGLETIISPLKTLITFSVNAATTSLVCPSWGVRKKLQLAEETQVRLRDDFDDEIVLQEDNSPQPDYSSSDDFFLPEEESLSVQTLRLIVPAKEAKPFIFTTADGTPDGVDIRLAREIAARLGKKLIIEREDMTEAQMFEHLRNGHADTAAGRILEKASLPSGIIFSKPYASVQEKGERIFTVLAFRPGFTLTQDINSIIKELTAKQFVNKILSAVIKP